MDGARNAGDSSLISVNSMVHQKKDEKINAALTVEFKTPQKKSGNTNSMAENRLQNDLQHPKNHQTTTSQSITIHSPSILPFRASRFCRASHLQHISPSEVIHPEGVLLVQEAKATHQRQRGLFWAVADAVLEEKGRGQVDMTCACKLGARSIDLSGGLSNKL